MTRGYRPVQRDQQFPLPHDMKDRLSDDHLAWFALDVAAALGTSPQSESANMINRSIATRVDRTRDVCNAAEQGT
jgi:hypothetical protein